jgi:hypothetical protein
VSADGVVADAASWIFDGTGLNNGDHILNLIGTEYDRVDLQAPTPKTIEVLFHSPLTCHRQASFSDAAIYSAPSGAQVFDTGTGAWICKLYVGCPKDSSRQADMRIVRITKTSCTPSRSVPRATNIESSRILRRSASTRNDTLSTPRGTLLHRSISVSEGDSGGQFSVSQTTRPTRAVRRKGARQLA